MRTKKRSQKLTLRPNVLNPTFTLPSVNEIRSALKTDINSRSSDQLQAIFLWLMLNKKVTHLIESTTELEELAKLAEYKILQKNDVLFYEGDDSEGWYVMFTGTTDVIIRLFLVAEDCLFDSDETDSTEFAPLMSKMDLDIQHDKLQRVKVNVAGDVFAYHSYIPDETGKSEIDGKRHATIVCSSDYAELVYFPTSSFEKYALIKQKDLYQKHCENLKRVFPRIRDDQVEHLSLLSEVMNIPAHTTITSEKCFGRYIYIIKSGTIARYRVVDFSDLSFRTISAPFETLQLHFPDGMHPVHTDNLVEGSVFLDPSVHTLTGNEFNIKTKTDVVLIALDIDYFKIIVGTFELERVRQEIKSTLTDDQVRKIWVDSEKKRLWEKFKTRTAGEAKREIKGENDFKTGYVVARKADCPSALPAFRPRIVKPYAPSHLAKTKDFSEPMVY
ncbi:hypothetical protein TVAG_110420 [Trichomonas vaginalis G3]|uniref:Cyclic nucleotide-binding domain-containing protein n=1 Tax=Trichomonas vaginalis (strain ATCC PRA-98 / G3) TaxID=412133 RepID=A2DGP3_TRIV3|nr:RmlC-like jelly roll fold domain-containing protein [Trichomonas vaginalis G3]EAY20430.1 hypothetical protein TVAG_110420 [Trichomonas vaginalis G3]KAI5490520.1 RmlC-like jelly roll fold domain-containing protein [Trichomonas vaginalis G3]|eukprot:XP_001581416.1 hypothetical protein [Trichomonas vaginalis G3]